MSLDKKKSNEQRAIDEAKAFAGLRLEPDFPHTVKSVSLSFYGVKANPTRAKKEK